MQSPSKPATPPSKLSRLPASSRGVLRSVLWSACGAEVVKFLRVSELALGDFWGETFSWNFQMLRIFHLLCHSRALPWEFVAVSLCVASNHSKKQSTFLCCCFPSPLLPACPLPQHEGLEFPTRSDQSSLHQCHFLISLVTQVNVSMFHGDGLPTIDRVLAYGNDYFLIPFTF